MTCSDCQKQKDKIEKHDESDHPDFPPLPNKTIKRRLTENKRIFDLPIVIHGGDRIVMAETAGRSSADLLDFSVNIRPGGPPAYVSAAITRALSDIGFYPSAHAEEAVRLASKRYGLSTKSFVFGNGTNELIHTICRLLAIEGCPCAVIPEPAFSEYAEGCQLAGLSLLRPFCRLTGHSRPPKNNGQPWFDWELPVREILKAPHSSAVFLANPGNPAGTCLSRATFASLVQQRPDILWILDEAFITFHGPDDKVSVLPMLAEQKRKQRKSRCEVSLPHSAHVIVLRSLTKFHALPGLRLGFLATEETLANKIRKLLPSWNVNCLALSAACAILTQSEQGRLDEKKTRANNRSCRHDLAVRLAPLPLTVCRSTANYLLLRLHTPFPDLNSTLLKRFGIALRDCSDYLGLTKGEWYRIGIRNPSDHKRLSEALTTLFTEKKNEIKHKRLHKVVPTHVPALMIQGTSSCAGKSILAAAFCRIFRQDGLKVMPFKAQNMSLNSGVTPDGGEIGRAQILQAQAAGVDPDVRMNPVLLKPNSDKGSQVVLLGHPTGLLQAKNFLARKPALWETVCNAYKSLSSESDVMVLEGAGSPAEINLKEGDIVNMAMAREAGAKVLLCGDIDRGGVYASFLGTWLTFSVPERNLLGGYIINRFRGDASLLAQANNYLLASTKIPVLGIVPYLKGLKLPEEDSLTWNSSAGSQAKLPDALDVAVISLRHTSNFTDFAPLALEPDVTLRIVSTPSEWGQPDLVIVPGSKNTSDDLKTLCASALVDRLRAHAQNGGWIFGICGGMQMLGETLNDPNHVESRREHQKGLGLLPLSTTLSTEKTLRRIRNVETPLGVSTSGYEIHHGLTNLTGHTVQLFGIPDYADTQAQENPRSITGVVLGRCWGSYLHGIFDSDLFRRAFLDHIRQSLGMPSQGRILIEYNVEKTLDMLADTVRDHVDMISIRRMLGLGS